MHICNGNVTITGSENGLLPGQRQAIICTNAAVLLIGPFRRISSDNSIEILTFSFKKMRLKVSSVKWRPFCLSLSLLSNGFDFIFVDYFSLVFVIFCNSGNQDEAAKNWIYGWELAYLQSKNYLLENFLNYECKSSIVHIFSSRWYYHHT